MMQFCWGVTAGAIAVLAPVAAAVRLPPARLSMLGMFVAGAVLGMAVTVMCMMGEK